MKYKKHWSIKIFKNPKLKTKWTTNRAQIKLLFFNKVQDQKYEPFKILKWIIKNGKDQHGRNSTNIIKENTPYKMKFEYPN